MVQIGHSGRPVEGLAPLGTSFHSSVHNPAWTQCFHPSICARLVQEEDQKVEEYHGKVSDLEVSLEKQRQAWRPGAFLGVFWRIVRTFIFDDTVSQIEDVATKVDSAPLPIIWDHQLPIPKPSESIDACSGFREDCTNPHMSLDGGPYIPPCQRVLASCA